MMRHVIANSLKSGATVVLTSVVPVVVGVHTNNYLEKTFDRLSDEVYPKKKKFFFFKK